MVVLFKQNKKNGTTDYGVGPHKVKIMPDKANRKLKEQAVEEAYKEEAKWNLMNKKSAGRAEGRKEAYKEEEKQKILDSKKIEDLLQQSNRTLYEVSTVFPFTFFPTKVIIAEDKVDIENKLFFKSMQTSTLRIEDIKLIEVTTSWFFACLRFDVQWTELPHPEPIDYLKKRDASKAKNIIDGLIAMKREGIDLANFNPKKVAAKAEEIGHASSSPRF